MKFEARSSILMLALRSIDLSAVFLNAKFIFSRVKIIR